MPGRVVDLEPTGQLNQVKQNLYLLHGYLGILDNHLSSLNLSVFLYKVVMTVLNSHKYGKMS